MQDLDLSKIKKIFFVGIGGIGISAIARMMLLESKEVLGSDIGESEIINELKKLGAKIMLGQGAELVPKDVDLIIYSIAVPKYDPNFFKELQNLNIKILSYPQMLGLVTKDKYTIAVSGTWRRLEKRGETGEGTVIYDDYAHHPTEIKASLEALRELYPVGEKKITILFQPHLYSRT